MDQVNSQTIPAQNSSSQPLQTNSDPNSVLPNTSIFVYNPSEEQKPNANNPTSVISEGSSSSPIPQEQVHAGFLRRFIAWYIDNLIIYAIAFYIFLIITLASPSDVNSQMIVITSSSYVISLILIVATFVYFPFSTSRFGYSFGKYVTGLKVIDAISGKSISFGRGLLRFPLGYLISSLIFELGFIWIAIDKNKQAWHDKIAHTFVIKTDKSYSTIKIIGIIVLLWIIIGIVGGIIGLRSFVPLSQKMQTGISNDSNSFNKSDFNSKLDLETAKPVGGQCTVSFDCQSEHCVKGVCTEGKIGDSCKYSFDCQSPLNCTNDICRLNCTNDICR